MNNEIVVEPTAVCEQLLSSVRIS